MEPVISAVVVLAAATAVLKKLVDLIRNQVASLNGPWVVLVALVLGTTMAWFFDFQVTEMLFAEAGLPIGRDLPTFADYIVAGAAMTGFAGYLHDQQKAAAASSVAELEAPSPDQSWRNT